MEKEVKPKVKKAKAPKVEEAVVEEAVVEEVKSEKGETVYLGICVKTGEKLYKKI